MGIVALLLVGSLIAIATPWLAGLLTASILSGDSAAISPAVLLAAWLGLVALRSLVSLVAGYTIGSTGQQITAELRNRLYQHMQALPMSYHHDRRRGDTLSLLHADAAAIGGFVTGTLVQLLPALATFAGALAVMAWVAPLFAALALAVLPAFYLLVRMAGRGLRPLSRAWIDANSRLHSLADENLGMLPAIKAFGREELERGRFEAATGELLGVSRRQLLAQSAMGPIASLLGALALVGVLWVGNLQIQNGQLSAPELVSLLLYAMLLMYPLNTLSGVYGQLQTALGAAERIASFLAEQAEPADSGKALPDTIAGELRFESLHFAYAGRPPLLRGLDLQIRAGETVALTGTNGAGKSTLALLLLRFMQPQRGRILIDGEDIRDIGMHSLRAAVGLVAQRVLLVNGTVTENIGYGLPGAAQEQIEQAAQTAQAHEFICKLPQGYDTVIGDQGVRLSGGQCQRLSLARALLRDPPILVLDEATAMFDPIGEEVFIERSGALFAHKTILLITHRPASLSLADRVLVLENGRISECSPAPGPEKAVAVG